AKLGNTHVTHAEVDNGYDNHPEIIMQFNDPGSRIWENMTMANKGKYLAIIIDKKVISAPHVNDAISGGSTSISGGFKKEEVYMMARQLSAGYIPADIWITESNL